MGLVVQSAHHLQLRPHVSDDSPPCTPAPLTWQAVMPTMPRADSALTTFCSRHGRMMACVCRPQSEGPCGHEQHFMTSMNSTGMHVL